MSEFLSKLPLTLYVHFPWCVRKCPYCDFNSHKAPEQIDETGYLNALKLDLDSYLDQIGDRQIISVYIGGGTPSLLSAVGLNKLLDHIRQNLNLLPDAEITLEANPETVESARFVDYFAAGINRFSLGIQSLNDDNLQVLGRIHNASQASDAIEIALNTGARVNLDLMTALPGQTSKEAAAEARKLTSFGAEHLSVYRLTLEPATQFFRNPPSQMLEADQAADVQEAAEADVVAAGYSRYEVSAYCRDVNARSVHNMNYWTFGDYIGIGAGAHAKLTGDKGVYRLVRHKSPNRYMAVAKKNKSLSASSRWLTDTDLVFEFMLNALRLVNGFEQNLFNERTSLPFSVVQNQLEQAINRGLMTESDSIYRPTVQGMDLLNDLCMMFMPNKIENVA